VSGDHAVAEPHLTLDWNWENGPYRFRQLEERDIESLRDWRNLQQAVLRQQEPISAEHQLNWFLTSVVPTYTAASPRQLLVAVEEQGQLVAYGGLTNIEWTSRRAEVSFLCANDRAVDARRYAETFSAFLTWLKRFTFAELGFNRMFTETWSTRTEHLAILESCGWRLEGRMRQHVYKEGQFDDALLHGILASDPETQMA
jgi:RimJ/RimL family protein N-acetyltransferase